jgi:site-specific DNA-methyltransferase (adenine-specific)
MMNNEQKPQLTIPRVIGSLSFYNADNMAIMKTFKDKEFDLAIVDPPYGIGISSNPVRQQHEKKDWDNAIPTHEYFEQLFRVSKNQIIWGGNYFPLKPTQCFYIWDKKQPHDFSLAMCEMAWTSFSKPAKIWSLSVLKEKNKIHPTQKPVEIYDWILKNNVESGMKILDTHLGSGSIAIAIEKANRLDKMNLQFVGIEIDKEYFEKALNRIEQYCRQGTLSF